MQVAVIRADRCVTVGRFPACTALTLIGSNAHASVRTLITVVNLRAIKIIANGSLPTLEIIININKREMNIENKQQTSDEDDRIIKSIK